MSDPGVRPAPSCSKTVAVIDCGTNSIRLLISEQGTDGVIGDVCRRLELVRLGEGVDATGEFAPAALIRTFEAIDRYAAAIRTAGATRVRFVATSAARDVSNRNEFFAGVRDRLGIEAEVISGDEEARLSFSGALGSGALGSGALGAVAVSEAPVLVVDIGGGSTELVLGRPPAVVESAVSLDIGSVRLRERLLAGDPPTGAELTAAREHVDALLDSTPIDLAAVRTWIGVAGTATSFGALHLDMLAYDRDRVHGTRLPLAVLRELSDRLCATPVAELVRNPLLPTRRAEVICGGALILERIAARVEVPEMIVSDADLLDGIVADLLS